ncbi:hypothetical protein PA905_16400 [Planktothrix agardhii CCAP 1459/11A]|uniref:Methyl-accepting chemotaxis sensory transducer n=1 Tax=Planktothrix agardhii CCAP 1459/11A TaxID=282420 RepID=A0A4P5ZCQ3_PLAAG|nr:hypothetical protein [Planktothrix agardhii]GDZ93800.1 hypothetical protein PA905_16400 [Planktothrix agardhii CCAP 1459/11A]
MSSQSSITFDSTLAFVLSHDFRVSSTTLGKVVAQNFAQNPNLPGVIVCENNIFRIIDIQVLLLAQNQLLNYAQNVIQQQQSRIQQSSEIIKIEKNKVQKCSKYYQSKQELLKKNYKDFLKVKQQEIFETAQKITEINENFLQISQLVIKETDKSFNEIVVNTNSINSNTNHIQEISTSIADDLDSMHSASNLINKIIQQIRHLAVKGSIVAYQSQSTPQGFNQINKEINQMLNQILNINQQMNKMANHFKFHVHKLQDIAQNQSGISRSVSLKLERVEMVMKELKHLIDNYNPNLIILIVEQAKNISPELIQFLDYTPEKQINLDSNGKGLIELIERTLKHRNDSPPSKS